MIEEPKLAIEAHAREAGDVLDLRASADEICFLRPNPSTVWRSWIEEIGGPHAALELASDYGLGDPHGEERAARALALHHRARLESGAFSFSAGISGLLQQLAANAGGGLVLVERLGHPDFAYWARLAGATIEAYEALELLPARIHDLHPATVVVDRPNVLGDFMSWDFVRELSSAAARTGALILVDEAYANYLGPEESLVQRVHALERVVVLRSLSKGYRMGGLRVGYAVAAPDVKAAVRRRIAPLGTSSLPFHFGLELLSTGDIFAELRERTALAKREAITLLIDSGFSVIPVHPCLPWVLVEDRRDRASHALEARGIVGRRVPFGIGGDSELTKLAVPLSDRRRQALADRLGR